MVRGFIGVPTVKMSICGVSFERLSHVFLPDGDVSLSLCPPDQMRVLSLILTRRRRYLLIPSNARITRRDGPRNRFILHHHDHPNAHFIITPQQRCARDISRFAFPTIAIPSCHGSPAFIIITISHFFLILQSRTR